MARFSVSGFESHDSTIDPCPRHLLRHPDAAWEDITDLPRVALEALNGDFVKCTSRVVHCQHSADGETSKLLLELQDGLAVEAVIMHYDTTGAHEKTEGCTIAQ